MNNTENKDNMDNMGKETMENNQVAVFCRFSQEEINAACRRTGAKKAGTAITCLVRLALMDGNK